MAGRRPSNIVLWYTVRSSSRGSDAQARLGEQMLDIPFGLRQAIEARRAVLFLGAGIGAHLFRADGSNAPDGAGLARALSAEFGIVPATDDLAKAAQVAEIRKGRTALETFIRELLADVEPDAHLQLLATLPWRAIFTTNYDRGLIKAYEHSQRPVQIPVVISATSDIKYFNLATDVPVYFLHGVIFGEREHNIIVTEDDYARFRDRRSQLFNILKSEFATCNFFYVGYSNNDQNWRAMLEELTAEFSPSALPQSYRLAPATTDLDREILKAKSIETIDGALSEFAIAASTQLQIPTAPADLNAFAAKVPQVLAKVFASSPAPVVRLLGNWEYANDADTSPTLMAAAQFFDGNKPTWGTIGTIAIERDVEEEIYEGVVDFVTSAAPGVVVLAVLAPAGYGTSTVLMRLAFKAIQDRLGPVLRLRDAARLIDGDCLFAAETFSERPIFIVDDASLRISDIRLSVQRLREQKKPALFIIGSRLNEWRDAASSYRVIEHIIEPLSDPEIRRLLLALSNANKLGVLGALTDEERFRAIKEKHQKEMLVALREATEGRSFDAIIQDEYYRIPDELSRHAYYNVCCFYQHGAYVRDNLLAELVGVELSELYPLTAVATEGVVIYDEIDSTYGRFGARARHKTIAAIVWARCGDPTERDSSVLRALGLLNVNYASDVEAFERFYRNDKLVDGISTLEKKTQFFELALRKDPDSPYIRQHYARMLRRSGQTQLALGQIEEAIKISPRLLVLHHTKAHILATLMHEAKSSDVARRYMVRSEDSYRNCLDIYDRDDYALQGLAQLYVDWGELAETEEEFTSFVALSEKIISDGLRRVDRKESLYIVSANIQKLLGDRPASVKALEDAYESSKSPYSAFLLARAYRVSGHPEKSIGILEPMIGTEPEEFRLCIEHALSTLATSADYERAIAVLRLGDLYGLSDARFVAMLGGCYFMRRNFDIAEKIFKDAATRKFDAQELWRVSFRPRLTDGQGVILEGVVSAVHAGYSFIEPADWPRFFCPGTKYNGITMNPGKRIRFAAGFSVRGAVAEPIAPA